MPRERKRARLREAAYAGSVLRWAIVVALFPGCGVPQTEAIARRPTEEARREAQAQPEAPTEPQPELQPELQPEALTELQPELHAIRVPPAIRIPLESEHAIDALVERELAAGAAPGCVVAIGDARSIAFLRAYGWRAIEPAREPMTTDTIFDLASVTKAVATTTSILRLVERGAIELDAPARRYLPELRGGGRERITVRHLLTHTSGLPAVDPLTDYDGGERPAIARIARAALEGAPGGSVRYSDLGFILLGEIVARVDGRSLDRFAHDEVFAPLGMRDTLFVPDASLRGRIAPTERAERRGGEMVRGVVHDPRAFRLGGVAGNAGLFSTAEDLSRLAQSFLRNGDGVLSPASLQAMARVDPSVPGRRALGWDVGHAGLSARAFGHGGYTGTSLWIDPEAGLYIVLLSNRVHPNGRGDVQRLVRELGPLARDAMARAGPSREGGVLNGVDVLAAQGFEPLRGARIALLTHDAARARDGRRTLDVLAAAPGLEVVSVLAPEHGLGADREGAIADGRDARTRLPVHGLFGPRRTPSASMLVNADTLVVDLVDVGARFFTYGSTASAAMRAASQSGLRVVVLDRPCPLGGAVVRGPVSSPSVASFVNHHPLPVVHGMTLGELMRFVDAQTGLGARLEIVQARGWRREMAFEETGLRWVPPSPNLRTLQQVRLYPGVALLEGTNVSVGRGTDAPFEQVGAPWIDGAALAAAIDVPGARITPTRFTPRAGPYRGQPCEGVRIEVVDGRLDPVRLGLSIARALARVSPERWNPQRLLQMIGDRATVDAVLAGEALDRVEAGWTAEQARFLEARSRVLVYERVASGGGSSSHTP